MAKYISLSFDDGRWDTYCNVLPIMEKHDFKITVNVITDFIEHPMNYHLSCCRNGAMTVDNLLECAELGHELAAQGATHQNSTDDVISCISRMKQWGFDVENIGFASPHSYLTPNNADQISALVNEGIIKYIRSGIQTRRLGLIYAGLTWFERKTHSKRLFWWLNKRCVLNPNRSSFILSITVTASTTVEQLMYVIERMRNEQAVVFNFHSILRLGEPGYGEGTWYWDADRLDSFCERIRQNHQLNVVRTIELVRENHC